MLLQGRLAWDRPLKDGNHPKTDKQMQSAEPAINLFSRGELERLRFLVPLHTLPDDAFAQLIVGIEPAILPKGGLLFRQGETDHENIYLLSGDIALMSGDKVVERITLDNDLARFPIAHQLPRKYTARAASAVRFVRLDSRLLSDLLVRSRTVDYQVDDLAEADEGDWMALLLQSRVLQQIPAANIQRVMMSVDQVETAAGEVLIRQGDPGDYYYMLTQGHAVVTRDMKDGQPPVELAQLGPGNAFGEEALLSDSPRNSTVSMLSKGQVLRLSKTDFVELIHSPLSKSLSLEQALQKIEQGALWLDLRPRGDYEASHLPGSINLPFDSLRFQAGSLAADRHYVLFSKTGGLAVAAAFLLTERGFDVSVLSGGWSALYPDEPDSFETPQAQAQDENTLEARVRLAEQHAGELEKRLQHELKEREKASLLKREHLGAIKEAVEKARRKILAAEREKQTALKAQRDAYAEMERLTGNLDVVQSEREALRSRMSEIQGLDKKLQERLARAERELIGQREQAESACSSLEEISQRLTDVLNERELERERHAREAGELKEEMTVLQLELEQTRMDMEELRKRAQKTKQKEIRKARQEAEAMLTRVTEEKQQVDSALAELADREQALRSELDKSNAGHDRLRGELDAAREEVQHLTAAQEAWQQERDDLQTGFEDQLAQQAARVEGADDLVQACKALSDEVDELRVAQEDQQARAASVEADLQKQLETAQGEARQQQLQTAELRERHERHELLEAAHAKLTGQHGDLQEVAGTAQREISYLKEEREALREQLASQQQEADRLRGVMEEYVEQIDANKLARGDDEISALQLELAMVREQAVKDVAAMREELARNATALTRLQTSGGEEVVAHEAMRQEIGELRKSLQERQRELSGEEQARQMLEDALEDANAEIDDLRRKLDGMVVDVEEAQFGRREAEDARTQVQAVLYRHREEAEEARATDLRDERLRPDPGPLGLHGLGRIGAATGWVLGPLVGAALVMGALEIWSFLNGHGELLQYLMGR